MRQTYICTVQVIVEGAVDEDEANDLVTDVLQGAMLDGRIADWAYLKLGEQVLLPSKTHLNHPFVTQP